MVDLVLISFASKESKKIGLNLYNCNQNELDALQLKKSILANKVDILILRFPTSSDWSYILPEIGFPCYHLDTLVKFSWDFKNLKLYPSPKNLLFERIDYSNLPELRRLILSSFANYTNHYTNNPYMNINTEYAYMDWAESILEKDATDESETWIVKEAEQIQGFFQCELNVDRKTFENPLFALQPNARSRGIAREMVRFIHRHYAERGYLFCYASTQVQNIVMQRLLSKEQGNLVSTYETYHICSFLSYSKKTIEEKFTFKKGLKAELINAVQKLASLTGLSEFGNIQMTCPRLEGAYRLKGDIVESKGSDLVKFVVKVIDCRHNIIGVVYVSSFIK